MEFPDIPCFPPKKMPSYEYSLKGQPLHALLHFSVFGHNDSDRRSVADLRGMCINVNANHSKLVYNIGLNHLFISPSLAFSIPPLRLTPPLSLAVCSMRKAHNRRRCM